MAPVAISTPNRAAFTQCSACSASSNRASRARSGASDRTVVTAVGPADPAVGVVAPDLPVALPGGELGDLDGVQPLDGLVAVHGGDVEPDRAAVGGGHGLAEHLVGDDHVVT